MPIAEILTRIAAELALFAGVGFLLFAVNDVAVDCIYFARRLWRSATVYSRYPRAFASGLKCTAESGLIVIFVPAWDEASIIASMLRATLKRIDHSNYRIFVGHYRRRRPAPSPKSRSRCPIGSIAESPRAIPSAPALAFPLLCG